MRRYNCIIRMINYSVNYDYFRMLQNLYKNNQRYSHIIDKFYLHHIYILKCKFQMYIMHILCLLHVTEWFYDFTRREVFKHILMQTIFNAKIFWDFLTRTLICMHKRAHSQGKSAFDTQRKRVSVFQLDIECHWNWNPQCQLVERKVYRFPGNLQWKRR